MDIYLVSPDALDFPHQPYVAKPATLVDRKLEVVQRPKQPMSVYQEKNHADQKFTYSKATNPDQMCQSLGLSTLPFFVEPAPDVASPPMC